MKKEACLKVDNPVPISRTIEQTVFEPSSDEFTVKVVTKPEEIKILLSVGFEYVCTKDELVFLRKRK